MLKNWKDFVKFANQAIKEMESSQVPMLKRGDLIPEGSYKKYKEIISLVREAKQEVNRTKNERPSDLQMQNLYWKEQDFLMDIFETREFPKLFDFFENL